MAAPVIGTRQRFAPRPGATIDRSHPLAQGLLFCFVPSVGENDLARGYPSTRPVGKVSLANTSLGVASNLTDGITAAYTFNNVSDEGYLGPISIMFAGKVTDGSVYSMVASKRNSSIEINTPFTVEFVTGPLRLCLNRGSGSAANRSSITGVVVGQEHVAVMTRGATLSSGDIGPSYLDGARATTTTFGDISSTIPTGSGEGIYVGARSGVSATASKAHVNAFAVWNRQLSATEAVQLYVDPYSFLKS